MLERVNESGPNTVSIPISFVTTLDQQPLVFHSHIGLQCGFQPHHRQWQPLILCVLLLSAPSIPYCIYPRLDTVKTPSKYIRKKFLGSSLNPILSLSYMVTNHWQLFYYNNTNLVFGAIEIMVNLMLIYDGILIGVDLETLNTSDDMLFFQTVTVYFGIFIQPIFCDFRDKSY